MEKTLEIIEVILFWIIYLLSIKVGGLLFGVFIIIMTAIYGLLRYYSGCKFMEDLYKLNNL